jgi:hypothetical protein
MWVFKIVPDQHDRTAELLVGGIEQGGIVSLGETASLTFAATVQADAVDQPAALTGLDTDQPGNRDPPGTLTRHRNLGCPATPTPGSSLRWTQRLAGLILETDPRTALRGYRLPDTHVSFRQVAMAASSRSTARCAGTCGENPIRCSRYETPRRV